MQLTVAVASSAKTSRTIVRGAAPSRVLVGNGRPAVFSSLVGVPRSLSTHCRVVTVRWVLAVRWVVAVLWVATECRVVTVLRMHA